MSNTSTNNIPSITNPLQNSNAAIVAIGYVAGICAAKFPIFDLATWNYLFMTVGGMITIIIPYVTNRKSVVISKVADLAEVKGITLDGTVPGANAINIITPANVQVR